MNWFNSLYARLAIGLVLLLCVIGFLYSVLNSFATQRFVAELNQDLNRTLAQDLVADKNLVEQGKLNKDALKKTFMQYMVVNPSIEIYLLDLQGKLISYSAEADAVKRNRVSLEPIKAFLNGSEKYPLGDDPRSHDKQKPFSVTGVPSDAQPEGYLYVVLRGEQYDALESMAYHGYWVRTGLWSMLLSLGLGLLAGLIIFYWLTKRLRRISRQMDSFSASDFSIWPASETSPEKADEIGQIEQTFTKVAERIQSQLAALTEKDNHRRQLVAQVSHDLRTPLASMLGYIESLKLKHATLADEERSRFLDIAYTQGQRLSNMIDSLFELSSLEAKEVQPQLESFMPLELLFDIKHKYAIRAKEKQLQFNIEHDELNHFAYGDVSLVERVLDNLIDNALVHADVQSTIMLRVEAETEYVKIAVRNQGPTIAEQDLDVLFDPFYRAQGQDADKRHAGLGLAISKRIMESQSGGIFVRNSKDGVVFSVYLPVFKN